MNERHRPKESKRFSGCHLQSTQDPSTGAPEKHVRKFRLLDTDGLGFGHSASREAEYARGRHVTPDLGETRQLVSSWASRREDSLEEACPPCLSSALLSHLGNFSSQ